MHAFSLKLRNLLASLSMSQIELARKLNMKHQNVSRWFNLSREDNLPRYRSIKKLAEALNVSPEYLVSEDGTNINISNNILRNNSNIAINSEINNLSSDEIDLIKLFRKLTLLKKNSAINFILKQLEEQ